MLESVFGNSFLVLVVLVFIAVLLLLEGVYLLWRSSSGPKAKKLQSRIRALASTSDASRQTQLLKQRMVSELPVLERYLQSLPHVRLLDRFILQSGLSWSLGRLVTTCALAGGATWMVLAGGLEQPMMIAVPAGLLAGLLPAAYVNIKRTRRLRTIERQLPDALDLITRALRAGHAFSAALKMVGEELSGPVADEFGIVHDEVNFGVSLQQALTHLGERVPSTDLRYFVVAVLIQRESGGNLTEILSNLSNLIRERLKLMGRVRVLSSEGRMSAWILGGMPFFLAWLMHLVNPEFMRPLWTDPIGISIVKYLLVLMVAGAVIMRKIVRLRV